MTSIFLFFAIIQPVFACTIKFELCRYDLMVACKDIGEGKRACPQVLGNVEIKPISAGDAYVKKLDSKRVNNGYVSSLLERYTARKTFRETQADEAVEYQI